MMEKKQLEFYDWNDLQKFFCNEMKIKQENFRSFHKIEGGEYKDFWHVWLSFVHDDVMNDSFHEVCLDTEGERQRLREKYGPWVMPLLDAIDALSAIEGDYITVRYSW